MYRHLLTTGLVAVALIAGTGSASAQLTPYAAGFAAYSRVPTFSIEVTDPTLAASLTIAGRKVDDAALAGGAFGIWKERAGSRWVWGVRGEGAYQTLTAGAQTLSSSGTFLGQPFRGPLAVPDGDGSLAFFTGTVLIGVKTGSGSRQWLMPYAGAGVGGARTRIAFPTSPGGPAVEDTDLSWSVQGVAGIDVALHRAVALYGEYRYTRLVEHEFMLGPQSTVLSAQPHQVVAGVRIGLKR